MHGSAIVAGLGRYQITYRADTGLFYSPVELSEEAKAKIRSDGVAYAGEVASQTPVRHGDVGAARFQKERRLCVLSLRPNPVKRYAGVQNCDLLAD